MKKTFKDDKIVSITNDVERIRQRPLMFIGLLGDSGCNHVCREAINNHIDECSKPSDVTPGDTIWIEFNEKEDMMISSDNGRGINTSDIVKIFTTLNSGSNMSRSNGYTLGENGVGSLCITALARDTIIKTFRGPNEGSVGTYHFREGVLVDEKIEPETDKHGLVVMYKPSQKVFGKDAHIDIGEMIDWVRSFKYRMSEKIIIHLKVVWEDGSILEETVKPVPFKKIIDDYNEKLIFPVEEIHFSGDMDEEFGGVIQNRTYQMDAAFGYVDGDNVPYIASFCNGSYTTDHGSHLDGVVNGITKYLRDATIASLSDKEKEKITITPSDVQTGMTISVNLMTNMMKLFVSQIKTKVDNDKLAKQLANAVYEYLSSHSNKVILKGYIDMIKTNAKARIEANLIRHKTMKEQSGKWDRYSIKQLTPCASMDKTKTELYICEGQSPKGSLIISRDPNIQAIFCIKGFPLNPFGKSISQILGNDEYKALIATMGCGIGDNFNINKLKYSKIIIATDADQDGYGIRSLMVSFFVIFYPEIVQRGMLYIADPPLYQIDYKPQEYVTTKKIYLDICEKIYNTKLVHVQKDGDGFKPIKDSTLFRDAVNFNRQIRAADIYRVHKNVVFAIANQTAKYRYEHDLCHHLQKEEFLDMISKIRYNFTGPFKEIFSEKRDGYIAFAGVYDLKYMGLDMNYAVYCRLEPLIDSCINIRTWEKIYLKNKATKEIMLNIAEDPMKVIECIISLMPRIKDRMKGLGQTDKEILTRTTLDPKTRTLIRVDINDDLEGALSIIKSLRGNAMEDLQARKAMLAAFEIDADDIDN